MSMTGEQAYALLKKYVKDSLAGAGALKGEDGKSAYELAVAAGFTGTLEEWLLQLQGEDGKTAYELAVELGFIGTEEEWLASLKGKDGGAGFDFVQSEPSDTWRIAHYLGNQYPVVVCVDEDGNTIVGDVEYLSEDTTIVRFCTPVSGRAHLSQSGGGGTPSGEIYLKVLVMDRYEYDALPEKDPNTFYMIRG